MPGIRSNAHPYGWIACRPSPLIKPGDAFEFFDSRSDRIVGASGKNRHDAISHVPDNETLVFSDDGAHPLEIGIDKIEILLRRHRFGNGCEATNIGKHDCHLLTDLIAELEVRNAFLLEEFVLVNMMLDTCICVQTGV